MVLMIQSEQKKHLEYIVSQPTKVLKQVLQKIKIINTEETKTDLTLATFALLKLLVDVTKLKLSDKEFRVELKTCGFSDEHSEILCNYLTTEFEIEGLANDDQYSFRDLEWRLEAKVASRFSNSLPVEPKIAIKLHLDLEKSLNQRDVLSETTKNTRKELVLQTDANNLVHIIDQLSIQLEAAKLANKRKEG